MTVVLQLELFSFCPRWSDWDDISVKHVWCFKSSFPTFSSNKYLQLCHILFQIVLKKKAWEFYSLGEVPLLCKKVHYKFYWIRSVTFSFFFFFFCNCVVVRHFLWAFSTFFVVIVIVRLLPTFCLNLGVTSNKFTFLL